MTEVPLIVLEHVTPAHRKALVIADNKPELRGLQSLDFDLDLIGLDPTELDALRALV